MSSRSDDDPVKRSSTERYSRVASNLDWVIVLIPTSSIFFGFLLHISVNPPSYFHFSDSIILLAASMCSNSSNSYVHNSSYPPFNSLPPVRCREISFDNKGVCMFGIICIMVTMYLGLGLALNSKLPIQIAYGSASLPFIFIFLRFYKHKQ